MLVDPPCTDLGTLASRPDARWRKERDARRAGRATQAAILRAGAARAAPGRHAGLLDLHDLAGRERAGRRAFLAAEPDFRADDLRSDLPLWDHPAVPGFAQTLPHRDGTEGFFIARLRREAAA